MSALTQRIHRAEQGVVVVVLAAMVVLPVLGTVIRWTTGLSMAGMGLYVQSLNLWLAFIGATIAARTGRHLALSTGAILSLTGRTAAIINGFTGAVAAAVAALLAYAGVGLVLAEQGSTLRLYGGIPNWMVQTIIPIGFASMAWRFAWYGGAGTGGHTLPGIEGAEEPPPRVPNANLGKIVAFGAIACAFALGLIPVGSRGPLVWGGSALILCAVALGAPIFTAMGGLAMVLFFGSPLPVPIAAVPAETYRIVASPTLPTIPLFTLAGYLLAEGGASKRLVELFQSWVGWIPGGTAAAAVLVCAFFTTFTGASGVTILALGGLLLPVLLKAGYQERFSIGLLTAAGSIGLLFPPSLPVILYGVVSHVPIDELYISGIIPGILLVGLLVGYGLYHGIRHGTVRETLDISRAKRALWLAKWEAMLPVIVLVGLFGGFMTVTESAAFTAAYAFFIEVVIHKDLRLKEDVPRVLVECATLVGGVLIILGVALGFTSYLVDAEIPMQVAAWAESHIANKLAFLLMLNLFLLVVGCLMDVFSAIMVVVPLIVPIGAAFGINPLHLGILFLANLELGYLTPPVGLNLFLASYRFEKPLSAVYRMALPFLALLTVGVLLIAYVPIMTTWHAPDMVVPGGMDDFDLDSDEDLDEPSQEIPPALEIPEGINLMDELNAVEDEPPPALEIPKGVNLMDELNAIEDEPEE
jgi:tripartite ATP-independent transporter DctM subunit